AADGVGDFLAGVVGSVAGGGGRQQLIAGILKPRFVFPRVVGSVASCCPCPVRCLAEGIVVEGVNCHFGAVLRALRLEFSWKPISAPTLTRLCEYNFPTMIPVVTFL